MSRRPEEDEELNSAGSESAEPLDQHPLNRELPPALKPLEAMLASLSPGADGLDYDLIMFRAGQRSVAGKPRRVSAMRSLAMPGALVATTAVACTLLVMLLARPVVYRTQTVYVPSVERSNSDQNNGRVLPEAQLAPDVLVERTWDLPGNDNRDYSRVRAASLEILDWMLQQEVEIQMAPDGVPADAPPQREHRVKDPVPYLQQLKNALDDQWHASVPSDWSNVSLNPGADS